MNRSQLRASIMAPNKRRSTFVQGARPGTIRPQGLSPGVLQPPPSGQPRFLISSPPAGIAAPLRRERRGALDELGVVGVVAGERGSIHGDLLLADRMIGQELG
jgi:hypothetical protein